MQYLEHNYTKNYSSSEYSHLYLSLIHITWGSCNILDIITLSTLKKKHNLFVSLDNLTNKGQSLPN